MDLRDKAGIAGPLDGKNPDVPKNAGAGLAPHPAIPAVRQKTLTIVVPSYNVEQCLRRCVNSLLNCDSTADIDIVIVDDGSTDSTPALADELACGSQGVVRVIHQENRGHGGAVNAGIDAAQGMYIKIVDADDWLDPGAYAKVLRFLRLQAMNTMPVDMVVTNYVYEKRAENIQTVSNYKHAIPTGRVLTWDDLRTFYINQYLLMHSIIYRASVLRESGMRLPEKTFYVDFIYAYQPLPYVKTMTYLDVDFYRYFIGREGQSVAKETMIRRVGELLKVNSFMVHATPDASTVPYGLYKYMIHYLSINCVVVSIFLILSKKKENYVRKSHMWDDLYEYSPQISHDVRKTTLCRAVNMPSPVGRALVRRVYAIANHFVGFN